jgi:hypothetical protein
MASNRIDMSLDDIIKQSKNKKGAKGQKNLQTVKTNQPKEKAANGNPGMAVFHGVSSRGLRYRVSKGVEDGCRLPALRMATLKQP